jgi:xylulokinase
MPRLAEGSAPTATVLPAMARRFGLRDDVIVAGGGGDNAASAVGMGAVQAGQGFVSLGTSGVIFISTDRFMPDPGSAMHAFCHALPARWHQMSVMLSAASAVGWATRMLGFRDEAALMSAAQSLGPAACAAAPLFMPYLSGERTPHNNPQLQGAWLGLSHSHDTASLAYAVVEGVSFGLLDGYRTLSVSEVERESGVTERDAQTPPIEAQSTAIARAMASICNEEWGCLGGTSGHVGFPLNLSGRDAAPSLAVVGGGSRSAYWVQLLASVLQRPLHILQGGDSCGALGAARLGWLADGGKERDVCHSPSVQTRFEPPATPLEWMATRHAMFRSLVHVAGSIQVPT